jgi:hypothetical protein
VTIFDVAEPHCSPLTLLVVAALSAIGIALGTLVSLLVSEYTPLLLVRL